MNKDGLIVKNVLGKLGFNITHIGYKYIVELILLNLSGNEILPLKGIGYTYIGKKYSDKVDNIDKNIQNAISYAWGRGNREYSSMIFGDSIDMDKGKPSNKQCIMTIICHIRTLLE